MRMNEVNTKTMWQVTIFPSLAARHFHESRDESLTHMRALKRCKHHPLVCTYPCPRAPRGELSRHGKDFSRAERTRLLFPRLAAWITRLVMFSLNRATCSPTLAEPIESSCCSLLKSSAPQKENSHVLFTAPDLWAQLTGSSLPTVLWEGNDSSDSGFWFINWVSQTAADLSSQDSQKKLRSGRRAAGIWRKMLWS